MEKRPTKKPMRKELNSKNIKHIVFLFWGGVVNEHFSKVLLLHLRSTLYACLALCPSDGSEAFSNEKNDERRTIQPDHER